MMFKRLLGIFFLVVTSMYAQGQQSLRQIWEQGLPYITTYTRQEYKAELQNWCVVQDDNGIIYVGNSFGILEYDGTSWRLIKTPGGNPIKSIAKDSKGRIYLGGVDELGYLEPGQNHEMKFHSLLNDLDSASRKFGDVWFTYSVHDSIYFICDTHVLRWVNNSFKIWDNISIGFSWKINDQLYMAIRDRGLIRVSGDSIISLSEEFKGKSITALVPYAKGGLLAFGSHAERYIYDGSHVTPFPEEKKLSAMVYATAKLSNGDHALGTSGAGLYLMDANGNIKHHFTTKEGLSSDAIMGVYEDAEGDVWLATDNGITRIEMNSPLRILNEHHGLEDDIDDITYFNGKLYAITSRGLFQLASSIVPKPVFEKVKGIDYFTNNCNIVGDELFISNYWGIYKLDTNNQSEIVIKGNMQVTGHPATDENHIFFGSSDSYIGEITKVNGHWREGKTKLKVEGRPKRIVQVKSGNIFISTLYNGVYEIAWAERKMKHSLHDNFILVHYDTLCGLPSLKTSGLAIIQDNVYVSSQHGLYVHDPHSQSFQLDSPVANLIQYEDALVGEAEPALDKSFWLPIHQNFETRLYKYKGKQIEEVFIAGRFSDLFITDIFDTNTGILLIGSDKGIVMYDESRPVANNTFFKTRIRKVLVEKDSAIYSGHLKMKGELNFSLPYAANDLRFQFAFPSYDVSIRNQYQYFLEGFGDSWSAWSNEPQADFTNLSEGDYVFRVRGKNIYAYISEEDRFVFTILPPWYRTWLAYSFYGLFFISLVSLLVNWRSRKLQQEKMVLENTVKERTEKITQQAEKLKEMDHVKSRFFANISHEFRTPLTLIKGPIENFLEHPEQSLPLDNAQMIRRNADRLLQLVNQLLDLSKLDVGNLKSELKVGDISKFIGVIASSFESLALQYNQVYTLKTLEAPLFTSFDHDKLEKIVYNLLSNAFKFTPEGGKIEFSLSYEKPQLKIQVTDGGMGIDEKHLPYIFDRFYQVDENDTGREGTGIGLSLVKELVSVLEGTVSVHSVYGQGTEFTVNLPVVESDAIQEDAVASEGHPKIMHEMEGLVPNDALTEEEGGKERETILLAEDNTDLRNYIGEQLSGEYNILVASTGKQALAITFHEIPDLIITDIMMPEMDGLSFCRAIKNDERTNHIPVIVLTAKVESESKLTGLETGADDYLTKPFDRHELLARVKNLVTLRKLLREKYRQQLTLGSRDVVINSVDEKFLKKVEEAIENNLSFASFGVPELQEQLAMSKTQFYRKMKALTDQAPGEFLRNYRLRRAAQLLVKQAGSVKEIAFAVGFANISYFTRSFKDLFGKSPSEYYQKTDKEKS